ncbi:MAG TPA: Rho termination factor N-terminal domain-containing protein, partial [Paludibacter sp.]|nr:Rho termination factor N-terminal domain-containing protein [Paludibacter sp.]
MSNYNILQLNAKELSELKDIATELGIKAPNSIPKDKLVYEILDQQAVVNAQRKTSSNENQDTDRKKRLRVSVKKTSEQKAFPTPNNPAKQPEKQLPKTVAAVAEPEQAAKPVETATEIKTAEAESPETKQ